MDRGAWWAAVQGITKITYTTEGLSTAQHNQALAVRFQPLYVLTRGLLPSPFLSPSP